MAKVRLSFTTGVNFWTGSMPRISAASGENTIRECCRRRFATAKAGFRAMELPPAPPEQRGNVVAGGTPLTAAACAGPTPSRSTHRPAFPDPLPLPQPTPVPIAAAAKCQHEKHLPRGCGFEGGGDVVGVAGGAFRAAPATFIPVRSASVAFWCGWCFSGWNPFVQS